MHVQRAGQDKNLDVWIFTHLDLQNGAGRDARWQDGIGETSLPTDERGSLGRAGVLTWWVQGGPTGKERDGMEDFSREAGNKLTPRKMGTSRAPGRGPSRAPRLLQWPKLPSPSVACFLPFAIALSMLLRRQNEPPGRNRAP
jgi:hypothetical protein